MPPPRRSGSGDTAGDDRSTSRPTHGRGARVRGVRARWARAQRRLVEALALRAGQPWAHQAPDDEACRDVLELLGDVFAQALECPAAIGAVLVGVEHRLFTGKVSGQGAAPGRGLRRARRTVCHRRARVLLVLQRKLELVERFRTHPIALTAQACELRQGARSLYAGAIRAPTYTSSVARTSRPGISLGVSHIASMSFSPASTSR